MPSRSLTFHRSTCINPTLSPTPSDFEGETMRMTDVGIRKLKPKTKRFEAWEDGRTGLGVRVSPKNRKTFVFMYWRKGKARRMTLGIYGKGPNKISLIDANLKHAEALKALEEGRDPGSDTVEANKAERDAETVTELIEEYLEKWAKPNKRSAAEDERILRKDVIPEIGDRKAKDITRRDIISLLDGIVARGAPVGANRTLAIVRRVFSWAVESDILGTTPCVSIKRRPKETSRDRVLKDTEIHTFWHGLDKAQMTEAVRLALKFQLATAQRRGEVVAAEWSELDRDANVWILPASKTKNSKIHIVPLSPVALDLLDAIEAIAPIVEPGEAPSRFLFPSHIGDKPITPRAVSRALSKNLGLVGVENVTPHDLRRSAATFMSALRVERFIVSRVLNHTDSTVTGIYDQYEYLDEKRAALERWARKLEAIISGKDADKKVVELAEHRT